MTGLLTVRHHDIRADSRPESEPERLANGLLDLIEGQVRTALDLGLGPQLEARVARLLPALCAPAAPQPAGWLRGLTATGAAAAVDPPASGAKTGPSVDPSAALDLAAVLTVCRQLEQFRLAGPQHAAIARLKAWVVAELARINHDTDGGGA